VDLGDGPISSDGAFDDAIVVQDGYAVRGHPDVALQPGGPQFERQLEARESVLRSVCPGATMAERDRFLEERREALLHV
jgi:hypothetical protein